VPHLSYKGHQAMPFILVCQANGFWAKVATEEADGIHTIKVSTDPSNADLVFEQPNGQFVRIATVLSGEIHTLAADAAP
jgi:hypothetical protein